ncbi:MAG TPA: UDPGP type 1 family protein [Lacunisphaera sp.]|jgi:UDP-N-acetylglucosamine/UDP-N-acetylgalactosamine diphosphorylase|nr:UDPGP type 1 family protein [Lacunisphaera sp.]HQY06091.1 UDPGP type 1 family protein [Lacunisphaera sp.]
METEKIITAFQAAGQGQVFAFWEALGPAERAELLAQAAEIDLTEVAQLNRDLVLRPAGTGGVNLANLTPAPCERLPANGGDPAKWAAAEAAGEAALRAGRVAAFTVAGGQGTRLGYDGPKGTFAVTPLRKKPLFQVFAEKIKAAGLRHGKPLHWFIMTSHANHEQTEQFFAANNFFGLDKARIHFFRQGRMPAVSFDGKILLETRSTLALSPDGHGGSLRALQRSGALDLMTREGIDTISYFQVDNPLVRCIDAAFIGFHLLAGAGMSSKMVPKAFPEEKVGHFCRQHGKVVVIEYSDMPLAMQRETEPGGALRYGAGSIAIHLIDREFARRMATGGEGVALPFHRADKKIATINPAGQPVKPEKANGVKFEMFVFDALPFAGNSIVIETARADDFSPVKNAEGVDSPATCRADQLRQFAHWLQAVGAAVETDDTGLPKVAVEVSPLFGYDAATFAESWQRLPSKPAVTAGLYLG